MKWYVNDSVSELGITKAKKHWKKIKKLQKEMGLIEMKKKRMNETLGE